MVGDLSINCECQSVHETEYDPTADTSPVEGVARAIAAVEGVETTELEPLYDEIELEALNDLFGGSETNAHRMLAFSVQGWNVFVRGDGKIKVCDPAIKAAPSPVFESPAVETGAAIGRSALDD